MGFILGLLLGLLTGAVVVYFLLSRRTTAQSAALRELQQKLHQAEADYDRRLKVATERLRQDYEGQRPVPSPTSPSVRTPTSAPRPQPPAYEEPVSSSKLTTDLPAEPSASATAPIAPSANSTAPSAQTPSQAQPKTAAGMAAAYANALNLSHLIADSYVPDPSTRQGVATAIANLIPTADPTTMTRLVPIIARLARDPDASVRLEAIKSLRGVSAVRSTPLLRRALRDTEPSVVAEASVLLAKFKGRGSTPAPSGKRRLPKNR